MRPVAMSVLTCLVFVLLVGAGCSKVNVEAKDESHPPLQLVF